MKTILVIDDDPVFCEVVNDKLSEKYLLSIANSGDEAVALIQENPFDLIITDIVMPGLDGIEVTQFIKKNVPNAKIIAVSAGGASISSERYLALAKRFGAQNIYSKHYPISQLTELVNEIL